MTDPITSPTNPQIKDLVRLRKRRERDSNGMFIVEGFRELTRAHAGEVVLQTLYVSPELYVGTNEPALVDAIASAGTRVIHVDPEPFRKASYRDRPEGLLAVAEQFDASLDRIDLTGTPLLLVAESIEKPGNLGTMLRTAEAAGLTGVVVVDPTTDLFNPNVVRASVGTLFSIPVAVTSTVETLAAFTAAGTTIVATTPDGDTRHHEVDFTAGAAIVVGSEQYGLSADWLTAADIRAVIDMPGSVDSLNAALAAGIVVFEAIRQRSA